MVKGYTYYNPPVFQIYDKKGKRVFASTNQEEVFQKYENLCKGGAE